MTDAPLAVADPPVAVNGPALMRRIVWRLVPFLCLLYLFNYLDRTNIAIAKLQMGHDIGLDARAYGIGSGIFYVGYCLFEIPSNLLMVRVGARRWIARILLSWGVVSALMMFASGRHSFYAFRLALGFAEAGFFPGIVLYLTYWVPHRQRARTMAAFLTSIALSGFIGGPLASLLMKLDGDCALRGWQWLFLLEGIPPILIAAAVLWLLPETPAQASWLNESERSWLLESLRRDDARQGGSHHRHGAAELKAGLCDGRVWFLSMIYYMLITGLYGVIYWLPTIIKGMGTTTGPRMSDFKAGMLSAVPYGVAAIGMVVIGRHSDRMAERRWHIALTAAGGTVALALLTVLHHPVAVMVLLSIATLSVCATLAPFWALPTSFLRGTAAAGGIALINSIGNAAGFFSNLIIGYLARDSSRTPQAMMYVAAAMGVGGLLVLLVPRPTPAPADVSDMATMLE